MEKLAGDLVLGLKLIKEALSLLMLCAPSNSQRPFSYHTIMADFEHSHIFPVFL